MTFNQLPGRNHSWEVKPMVAVQFWSNRGSRSGGGWVPTIISLSLTRDKATWCIPQHFCLLLSMTPCVCVCVCTTRNAEGKCSQCVSIWLKIPKLLNKVTCMRIRWLSVRTRTERWRTYRPLSSTYSVAGKKKRKFKSTLKRIYTHITCAGTTWTRATCSCVKRFADLLISGVVFVLFQVCWLDLK